MLMEMGLWWFSKRVRRKSTRPLLTSEKKAQSWYAGVLELRKQNALEPALKGVDAAMNASSKTAQALTALGQTTSLQAR